MKILIIGGGGREHALAWKLAQSPLVKKIVASPGNPGMAEVAKCVPAPEKLSDYIPLAQAEQIDFTIVGPEAPLVGGIVDLFRRRRQRIIGPSQAAAQLEGSKIFAKQFFERAAIPTARSIPCTSREEALDGLKHFGSPVVVKADGLAAGKGVVVAQDHSEAVRAIEQLGPKLVIEEFLEGEEISFIGLTNGAVILPFAAAKDHKRLLDGDQGPNTGGMGAYCDPNLLSPQQRGAIMERIMMPTLRRMEQEGAPFTGFLYAGIMMTADGPKVLEFNVRLGDPETQALLYSFRGDFAEVLNMAVNGIGTVSARAWASCSACVVMAAGGYPGAPITGDEISGIGEAQATGATVFQAATVEVDGKLITAGGRILGVTAGGDTLPAALDSAYAAVSKIRFNGMHFRTDIGRRALSAGKLPVVGS